MVITKSLVHSTGARPSGAKYKALIKALYAKLNQLGVSGKHWPKFAQINTFSKKVMIPSQASWLNLGSAQLTSPTQIKRFFKEVLPILKKIKLGDEVEPETWRRSAYNWLPHHTKKQGGGWSRPRHPDLQGTNKKIAKRHSERWL